MSVRPLKDKQDKLVIATLDIAVLVRPYDPDFEMPKSICDAKGKLLTTFGEDGFLSAGEIQKDGGIEMNRDGETTDIFGFGSKPARRRFKDTESFEITFTSQEARLLNKSLFYDTSLSAWEKIDGGHSFTKTSEGDINYWSLILVGHDRYDAKDIYPFWTIGKAAVGTSSSLSLSPTAELAEPITMTAFEHPTAGLFSHGIAGEGWMALANAAGFESVAPGATG